MKMMIMIWRAVTDTRSAAERGLAIRSAITPGSHAMLLDQVTMIERFGSNAHSRSDLGCGHRRPCFRSGSVMTGAGRFWGHLHPNDGPSLQASHDFRAAHRGNRNFAQWAALLRQQP